MNQNFTDKLTIKVLGSGCCVPRIERASPAYLVKYENKNFLMDCGAGTLRQLIKVHEDYKNIDGVIFSHFHPDHTSDFIPLIQALEYTPNFKREKELVLIGPKGLKKFIDDLFWIYKLKPINFPVKYIEQEAKLQILNNFYMESIQGNHSQNSIIVKLYYLDKEGNKKGFVYSGDTDFDISLANFSYGIDLLILECSFPYKVKGHLTPEEVGRLAQIARPKRLLLTHFYPPCDEEIDIKNKVIESYNGFIYIAQDYMEILI